MTCAALIPCFNEEATIGPLVKALRQQLASASLSPLGERAGVPVAAAPPQPAMILPLPAGRASSERGERRFLCCSFVGEGESFECENPLPVHGKPPFDFFRMHWDHEPAGGASVPASRSLSPLEERAGVRGTVHGKGELFSAGHQLTFVAVVDDGSNDQTALNAKNAGALVLRHERTCGKGAALQTGLAHLLNLGFEWAVTLDGDGQHDPADLPAFLRCAEQTGALLVIGNRMSQSKAMPRLRRWVNRWMSQKLSQHAGRPLPDTQCGFRLIHLPAWASLRLATRHFEVESEMLMAFLAAGHPVEFVPIRVVPGARASRIHPVIDSLRWFKWWRTMPRTSPAPATRETSPCPALVR